MKMDADPRQGENIVVNENDINNVILLYLIHNCFKDTAESFVSSTGMNQHVINLEDMERRKSIYQFVSEGNPLKAIELTEEFAPGLLEENQDLHFDLLTLHYMNLVCSRETTEAIGFAQSQFSPFGKEHRFVEKLEDFMALLAYKEPDKSPMFHLMSFEHRQGIAESLNRAILAHNKMPSYSAMEMLIQQTTVVTQSLSQESGKDETKPFVLKDFLEG